MKIYISGQISNRSMGESAEQFCGMERRLIAAGHVAVNPLRMNPYGFTWKLYMTIAKAIFESGEIDAVLMLKGWRKSYGARIEWIWAHGQGLKIIYEDLYDAIDMKRRSIKGR